MVLPQPGGAEARPRFPGALRDGQSSPGGLGSSRTAVKPAHLIDASDARYGRGSECPTSNATCALEAWPRAAKMGIGDRHQPLCRCKGSEFEIRSEERRAGDAWRCR